MLDLAKIIPLWTAYKTIFYIRNTIISSFGTTLSLNYKVNNEYKYEFTGQLTNSQTPNNLTEIIIPSSTVEVWKRVKPRTIDSTAESGDWPLTGVRFQRRYNAECITMTVAQFLEGRNNFLEQLIEEFDLKLSDWESYVEDLLSIATSADGDIWSTTQRKKALNKLITLIQESSSYQDGLFIPTPGSFIGGILAGTWTDEAVEERIRQELPKALFKLCQFEFLIPLVLQEYPNPTSFVNSQTMKPTCYDLGHIGVCCLFDVTIGPGIKPGLVEEIITYKKCITDIDEAICFNHTKAFTQSRANDTQGMYDGAEFFALDEAAENGCENCKNPVSVVYCSDGAVVAKYNAKTWEIDDELANAYLPTNIAYFKSSTEAKNEFARRSSANSCANTPTPIDTPLPPTIALEQCFTSSELPVNDEYTVYLTPDLDNDSTKLIEYKFWIDNTLVTPESITWEPRQTNSPRSEVVVTFRTDTVRAAGIYLQDSTLYVTANYIYDGGNGPNSEPSNEIIFTCIEVTTTPTVETPTVSTPTPCCFFCPCWPNMDGEEQYIEYTGSGGVGCGTTKWVRPALGEGSNFCSSTIPSALYGNVTWKSGYPNAFGDCSPFWVRDYALCWCNDEEGNPISESSTTRYRLLVADCQSGTFVDVTNLAISGTTQFDNDGGCGPLDYIPPSSCP